MRYSILAICLILPMNVYSASADKINTLHKTLLSHPPQDLLCIRCHQPVLDQARHPYGEDRCAVCHPFKQGKIAKIRPPSEWISRKQPNGVLEALSGTQDIPRGYDDTRSAQRALKINRLHTRLFKKSESDISVCFKCHKTHYKEDGSHPLDKNKCFDCHGLNRGKLGVSFIKNGKDNSDTPCLDCHQEKASLGGTKHDYFSWPQDLQENIYKSFGYTTKISFSCKLCHDIHHSTTRGSLLRKSTHPHTENRVISACTTCHSTPVFEKNIAQVHTFTHPQELPFSSVTPKNEKIELNFYDNRLRKASDPTATFEVVCSTCHNPHQWSRDSSINKKGESNIHSAFLSDPFKSMTFCASCHGEDIMVLYPKFHFIDR